jgi:hypothetical protein
MTHGNNCPAFRWIDGGRFVVFAHLHQAGFLFSANGAMFILAWGNAPGFRVDHVRALKARLNPQRVGLNRAFSADVLTLHCIPGALPQAQMTAPPLALSTCRAGSPLAAQNGSLCSTR